MRPSNEMAALVQAFDWSTTVLGTRKQGDTALATMVGTMWTILAGPIFLIANSQLHVG